MPIEGLTVIDPWFEGAAENLSAFEFVLDKFLRREFSLLEIDNLHAVTRLSAEEWLIALNTATQVIESNVGHGWRKSHVERSVSREFLSARGKSFDKRAVPLRDQARHLR